MRACEVYLFCSGLLLGKSTCQFRALGIFLGKHDVQGGMGNIDSPFVERCLLFAAGSKTMW